MKMNKEITQVCYECGVSANVLTCLKKYGRRPNQLKSTCSTFHVSICDICGEFKDVTEARDFFYPDFDLLTKVRFPKNPKPIQTAEEFKKQLKALLPKIHGGGNARRLIISLIGDENGKI